MTFKILLVSVSIFTSPKCKVFELSSTLNPSASPLQVNPSTLPPEQITLKLAQVIIS